MRFPSITTFIRAVWKFLGRPELVPNTIEYIRTYRCGSCIFEENQQCQKCSCYIPLKVKMATESCPIGKWGEYFTQNFDGLK